MTPFKRGLRIGLLVLGGAALIVATRLMGPPRGASAGSPVIVPIELVLLVDTSGSVDENEYRMQKEGYVSAFRDSSITDQIEDLGGIAVVYIEWDDAKNQTIRVPWTHLRSRADCLSFSDSIDAITRATSGTTMLAPALEFATLELKSNAFLGLRRVIDVSGDGQCKNWHYYEKGVTDNDATDPEHYGTRWSEVVAGLAGTVDCVNGVFIGDASEHLDFYRDVLPQGAGAFTLHAAGFAEFADTVKTKIEREIGVEIPGTFD